MGVVGAQVGQKPPLAGDAVHHFLEVVAAAVGQAHQLPAGQPPGALPGEGPLPLQGVVDLLHPAPMVGPHADAEAQVGHHQVALLVGTPQGPGGVTPCGALGEGVEQGLAFDLRDARKPGLREKFVHHQGVHHEGGTPPARSAILRARGAPRLDTWQP